MDRENGSESCVDAALFLSYRGSISLAAWRGVKTYRPPKNRRGISTIFEKQFETLSHFAQKLIFSTTRIYQFRSDLLDFTIYVFIVH